MYIVLGFSACLPMILAYTSLMIEEASPDLFNLGRWVTGLTVFITVTSRSWLPLTSHQCPHLAVALKLNWQIGP